MRKKNKRIKKGYMIGLLSVLLMMQACGMEKSDIQSESGKQTDGIENNTKTCSPGMDVMEG